MINFSKIVDLGRAMYNPETHPLRCFHLSVILSKNRLVSAGINSPKTHSLNQRNPKFGHDGQEIMKGSCSEFIAINRLKRISNIDFNKCVMVNIRINKLGQLANSCPCISCKSLLAYFSFKSIYFSDSDGLFQQYY